MPGLRAEGKRQGEQAQGGMGVDVVRLGEPALVHAYRHLRVRALFRVPGCRLPVHGQAVWGYTIAAASLVVALTAPVLGAIADAVGPRKPWVLAFSALYVVGAAGLWGAAPGLADPTAILAFLAIALIGAEYTGVFTNAALPALGGRDEIGRISGSGWALGYWGGLASLALVLGLIAPVPGSERTVIGLEPILGLDPERGEGARAVGPLSALWYIVFVVPFFLWTPDAPRRPRVSNAVATGLRDLKRTLALLPSRGSLLAYLVSSMFYRDALGGMYVFGGIYAGGHHGRQAVGDAYLGYVHRREERALPQGQRHDDTDIRLYAGEGRGTVRFGVAHPEQPRAQRGRHPQHRERRGCGARPRRIRGHRRPRRRAAWPSRGPPRAFPRCRSAMTARARSTSSCTSARRPRA